MKNTLIQLILLNFLLIAWIKGTGQDIKISSLQENIQISKDSTFLKNISLILKESSDNIVYPIFYDRELEEVKDIIVSVKKGKKFKPSKFVEVTEEDVDINILTSKKMKSIIIPPGAETKIT